jgi:nicotinamide mononucleotide transporter
MRSLQHLSCNPERTLLMENIETLFTQLHLDWIQVFALALGVSEVLLARANKVLLYPAGILAIILTVYSLTTANLFAEAILNIYYLVMSIYGWYHWGHKSNGHAVTVTFATRREWSTALAIVAISWAVLYFFLVTFMDSDVPVWDSFVSATGWSGMWLLARRKVENWIFLNISNAFAIPLLFHKQLPLYALLTAFLFIVACIGYFDWRKVAMTEHAKVKS